VYEDMIQYVKKLFTESDINATSLPVKYPFRNRFEHTMRVYSWAMRIAQKEKGDRDIVAIAAIFHDVGKTVRKDLTHGQVSAEICEKYLKQNDYPEDKINRILQCIRIHSFKTNRKIPLTLEDKILMDADMLDECGAISAVWDSMATAMDTDPSYIKVYERNLTTLNELKQQKKYLKTDSGKKFYKESLDLLNKFIKRFKYELGI